VYRKEQAEAKQTTGKSKEADGVLLVQQVSG